MTTSALLAVGHGSRDPRHAASLHGLLDAVRFARPGLRAQPAFLDLSGPDVTTALARLAASGARHVTVVPLFLRHGYHVRHDIPAVTAQALRSLGPRRAPALTVARQLGPDALVDAALDRRLREQGLDAQDPQLR
ncbi:MAG: sirohydrochlorin chelatase, partial [Actinocrinis sp.]